MLLKPPSWVSLGDVYNYGDEAVTTNLRNFFPNLVSMF